MVIHASNRTVRSIGAKDLLYTPPSQLEELQKRQVTLAQPIVVQISARAARQLIMGIYHLSQSASIHFYHKFPAISFLEELPYTRTGQLPIEELGKLIAARSRQLANAIRATVSDIRYLRPQSQEPCVIVSLIPA